jgi:hypothetical protein
MEKAPQDDSKLNENNKIPVHKEKKGINLKEKLEHDIKRNHYHSRPCGIENS